MTEKKTEKKSAVNLAVAVLLLFVPVIAISQDASQNRTLIVNGQSTQASVIQVNGRSYVDLEALASAINGSVSSGGSQVALSMPTGNSAYASGTAAAATRAPAPTPAPASNPGFSKGFLNAGIEQMASVREWHAALAAAIQNGFVTSEALAPYRAQAATKLRLASVAASTPADQSVYALLNNEFQNMVNLSDKYIALRANMAYIAPDALDHDPLNQGIVGCGHLLRAMAANGLYEDDGSCS
jgi:hypothetical protein